MAPHSKRAISEDGPYNFRSAPKTHGTRRRRDKKGKKQIPHPSKKRGVRNDSVGRTVGVLRVFVSRGSRAFGRVHLIKNKWKALYKEMEWVWEHGRNDEDGMERIEGRNQWWDTEAYIWVT